LLSTALRGVLTGYPPQDWEILFLLPSRRENPSFVKRFTLLWLFAKGDLGAARMEFSCTLKITQELLSTTREK